MTGPPNPAFAGDDWLTKLSVTRAVAMTASMTKILETGLVNILISFIFIV
jgi:hypothetical protein